MSAKENLYELSMKRFKVFESQDPEDEDFDVVFDINGKKLYADKFTLRSASPTFKSMLTDRWTKPGEPIKIEGYTFDEYKEFLTFIYSGECELTEDNIFAMVDIAEFYGIKIFKNCCETYLIRMLKVENVYQVIELCDKYSLNELRNSIKHFIARNLSSFLQAEKFSNLPESFITDFVQFHRKTPRQEDLFEALFKWAELRALKLQEVDSNLDLNDAIKNELSDFLPLLNYKLMNQTFITSFVVKKSFLFTDEQLKAMIIPMKHVQVTNKDGQIMKGYLQCPNTENVHSIIESQKNVYCRGNEGYYGYWGLGQPKPSTPSQLIKDDKIRWYLIFDAAGRIAVKRRNELKDKNYLLAEMFAEYFFILDWRSKIEVV